MFITLLIIFITGYGFIVFEHVNKINKAATALLTGTLLWALYALNGQSILDLGHSITWKKFILENGHAENAIGFITHHELMEHLSEISSILFFLIGAMTIVELIDKYQGFRIITTRIQSTSITKLLWLVGLLTFFMSAALDNLTTTIVMITVLRKILSKQENRWIFASIVIIAANAGGAWSPIGDVTTIMLWIGGQITTKAIICHVFLPSIVNLIVSIVIFTFMVKGTSLKPVLEDGETNEFTTFKERLFMLILGLTALISVPIFKSYTHLPPFMGMLLGLSIMWVITDRYIKRHTSEDKRKLTVISALKSIDIPTILFFLGILSAVAVLQSAGHLNILAHWLDEHVKNIYIINILIGVFSSIVDNVPLVAASMGMYEISPADTQGYLASFVVDGNFWTFLTYCAGTGGSILIIGSAAGVAAMGIEKIDFFWYTKRISWIALIGYLAGALTFYLQSLIF